MTNLGRDEVRLPTDADTLCSQAKCSRSANRNRGPILPSRVLRPPDQPGLSGALYALGHKAALVNHDRALELDGGEIDLRAFVPCAKTHSGLLMSWVTGMATS